MPEIVDGLALNSDDINYYLTDIAGRQVLSNFDSSLWTDLDRLVTRRGEVLAQHKDAIELGTSRHRSLHIIHSEIIRNRGRDWEKEREKERVKYAEQQRRRYAKHRAQFHAIREDIASGKAIGALDSIARAYMGLYSDLSHDGKPSERLIEWLGPELTEKAQRGFIAVLSRSDIPTAAAIAKLKSEGKIYTVERPLLCGIAELYAKQESFRGIAPSVLQSVLAAWWDMPDWNASTLGQGIQEELEARAFDSDAKRLEFLKAMMDPHISQGRDHIPGLHSLARDEAMQSFAGMLAIEWLTRFPTANDQVQAELLEIGVKYSPKTAFCKLVAARLPDLENMAKPTRHMWLAAGFVADVDGFQDLISRTAPTEPEILWAVRRLSSALADDSDTPILLKKVAKQEFIVREFVAKWPCVETPRTSWGDSHPHDAMQFILNTITSIASNGRPEASEALDRLLEVQADEGYRSHIKHMRAKHRRLRRDSEYHAPSFSDVTQLLAGGLPGTINDLKAMTLDRLETVQKYVRDGDTRGWEKFWSGDIPINEDSCRNRLLDDMRPYFDPPISVLPETLMPDTARADLVVVHRQHGLPIEIKGQWHKEVWDAALTQLDEQYTRDWRAFGRGIYLVFWHGPNRTKRLKKHPDGRKAPSSPDELRTMLLERLSDVERSRIDVVVFDVSKPAEKSSRKSKT